MCGSIELDIGGVLSVRSTVMKTQASGNVWGCGGSKP
jgi:hypothetical protein